MTHRSELLLSLAATWPVERWQSARLLLAVSGGADSVALLRAFHQLAPDPTRLQIAHFNHGWRGAESDSDEQFVRQLCDSLGLSLRVGRAAWPESAGDNVKRSEESARQLRYQFLRDAAYHCGARYVVTAHTASDRVESLLHNLCRGTGLSGACTPRMFRPLDEELVLVRPLLHCFRRDVDRYLRGLGQAFRHDTSNQNQNYRRNFLRQSVLPLLREQYGPQLDQHLMSFSLIVEEALETLQVQAEAYREQCQERLRPLLAAGELAPPCESSFTIPSVQVVAATWPVVQLAIQSAWSQRGWPLQGMSRAHWEKIRALWSQSSSQPSPVGDQPPAGGEVTVLPGEIRLIRQRDWLLLKRLSGPDPSAP